MPDVKWTKDVKPKCPTFCCHWLFFGGKKSRFYNTAKRNIEDEYNYGWNKILHGEKKLKNAPIGGAITIPGPEICQVLFHYQDTAETGQVSYCSWFANTALN